jgi:pyrrolidone-carboxylate peptidase
MDDGAAIEFSTERGELSALPLFSVEAMQNSNVAMPERTLVTGFGPFLDVTDNPSSRVAEGCGRSFAVLPVSYDAVEDFIFHLDPDGFDRLLLIGVAPSRQHICAELFARNTYGRVPYIQGSTRVGAIQADQALLLGSTLFGDDVLSDLLVHHPKVRMSLDAGSYLCNFAYFKALAAFPAKQVGFLHIPSLTTIDLDEQLAIVDELLRSLEMSQLVAAGG